ncbi:MAG: hypothetical protein ACMUIG_05885 [Thermoplasmatota archaeon]
MKGIGYLKGLMGALMVLTFFYSLALLIVIPIVLLVGIYVYSLFGNELFTQGFHFIAPGMFFIMISGVIDLLIFIAMWGIMSALKSHVGPEIEKARDRKFRRKEWIPYSIIASLILIFFFLFGNLVLEDQDAFYSLIFIFCVLLAFLVLKWKVIRVPAKALDLLGNEKGLTWARISVIPLLIFIFSMIPLTISFGYGDAPTETILLVYLEVIFALSVIVNLVNIGGLMKAIGSEIGNIRRSSETDRG